MLEDIKKDAAERMGKSVDSLRQELKKLRTGRAHTSLLDHVTVEYYGSEVPINQVAGLGIEDARTITVTPWERQMVPVVEKAILKSDLGLTPNTAGSVIRVPIPPLTEERRRDMVKVVRHEGENAKIAIRNIRRDALHHVKELLKEKEITEDDDRRVHDEIQVVTDEHVGLVDSVVAEKEEELLEV
jgi:ribosome recycling factor